MKDAKITDNIWAVVLAAGESRRMGTPKMLLPLRGKAMVEQVIMNIRNAGIKNILAVIGAEKEKLPMLLQKLSVNFCLNNNYREGMLSSVTCGLRNLPEEVQSIMIFPGDQPLISPVTISRLTEAYFTCGKGILIPVYDNKRGHPLLFDAGYRKEIESLDTSESLRSLSSAHPDDVAEIETDDPGILKDFDTYDEYLKEVNQIS